MGCPKCHSLNFEVIPVSFLLVLLLISMIFPFIHKYLASAEKHDINFGPRLCSRTSSRLTFTVFALGLSALYVSVKVVAILSD